MTEVYERKNKYTVLSPPPPAPQWQRSSYLALAKEVPGLGFLWEYFRNQTYKNSDASSKGKKKRQIIFNPVDVVAFLYNT